MSFEKYFLSSNEDNKIVILVCSFCNERVNECVRSLNSIVCPILFFLPVVFSSCFNFLERLCVLFLICKMLNIRVYDDVRVTESTPPPLSRIDLKIVWCVELGVV
jgi:hypothetical protein